MSPFETITAPDCWTEPHEPLPDMKILDRWAMAAHSKDARTAACGMYSLANSPRTREDFAANCTVQQLPFGSNISTVDTQNGILRVIIDRRVPNVDSLAKNSITITGFAGEFNRQAPKTLAEMPEEMREENLFTVESPTIVLTEGVVVCRSLLYAARIKGRLIGVPAADTDEKYRVDCSYNPKPRHPARPLREKQIGTVYNDAVLGLSKISCAALVLPPCANDSEGHNGPTKGGRLIRAPHEQARWQPAIDRI